MYYNGDNLTSGSCILYAALVMMHDVVMWGNGGSLDSDRFRHLLITPIATRDSLGSRINTTDRNAIWTHTHLRGYE